MNIINKMNKNQYHKNINNVNNYNNNYNYYNNNNYYNGYGYKKQYFKNNNNNMNNNMNNYNEDRKKNNYYNNNYNDMHNDYIYNQQTKKKKQYRYNNNNNYFYENNNEEIMSKSVNEKKDKIELLRIQINLKDNQCIDLVVYKDDDINLVVKKFCYDNNINENLIEPLINKIKQSLNKLNIVYNCVELDKDGVVMLEKAKTLLKNK